MVKARHVRCSVDHEYKTTTGPSIFSRDIIAVDACGLTPYDKTLSRLPCCGLLLSATDCHVAGEVSRYEIGFIVGLVREEFATCAPLFPHAPVANRPRPPQKRLSAYTKAL